MPIVVESRDKRIKAVMAAKPGASVRGLQLAVAIKIRIRIDVLRAANSLAEVSSAHPEWRVHAWAGRAHYYSIDVTGNYRLLFSFDHKTLIASDMIYDDPH